MGKHKNKIIIGSVIILLLALSFWWGGGSPGSKGWIVKNRQSTTEQSDSVKPYSALPQKPPAEAENNDNSGNDDEARTVQESGVASKAQGGGSSQRREEYIDFHAFSPSPDNSSGDKDAEEEKNICTISVRCDSILDNIEFFNKDKLDLLPSDGIILAETRAVFNEGENVFNVLQRELKRAGIHLEFTSTPIYDSVYIEGINNIYEFDCGENSGWLYSVNGEFPSFGCSRYTLKSGDVVEWKYTCDFGRDIGGYYASES